MFTPFFYKLKERKVPTSISEWMVLMEALDKGLIHNMSEFYYLARAILGGVFRGGADRGS